MSFESISMHDSDTASPDAQQAEILRLLQAAAEGSSGDFYGGKRRHMRFRLSRPFDAEEVDSAAAETLAAHMQDISCSGISFWCKSSLDVGTRIRIREYDNSEQSVWFHACVSHNTPGIRGYLIGAAFEHPVPEDAFVLPEREEPEVAPPATPEKKGFLQRIAATFSGSND